MNESNNICAFNILALKFPFVKSWNWKFTSKRKNGLKGHIMLFQRVPPLTFSAHPDSGYKVLIMKTKCEGRIVKNKSKGFW